MSYDKKFKEYKPLSDYEPKETVKDVLKLPFAAIPERKISKEVCERFGVRVALSQSDGKTIEAVYFPYYNAKGKLSGFKKRNLLLDKTDKGHFTAIGSVGVASKLFGQDVAESIQRKRSNLAYVEGEFDVLSTWSAMRDQVRGTKFEDMEPFVVGLSCGTANAIEATIHNEHFVKSFASCTLAFDGDHATDIERQKKIKKGLEAREDVASVLNDVEITTIDFPNGYKDPSDMLQDGKGDELAKLIQFGKKPYTAEKIIAASSVTLDELLEKRVNGIYTGVFPELDHKLHGFRTSELVVFTAPSNVGKSLVTSHIMYKFLEAGQPIGMCMLEETTKESLQRLVAQKLKCNFNKFKEDPLSCATHEQISDAYNWVTQENSVFFLDHFGSMQIDTLMNKIKSFVYANKVKYLLLDHLSMVISGSVVADERKELDLLMTQLAAFCAANEVCIIAVCHLNRTIAEGFKPPKGKEDQPFWVPVTKEAMRSSSSLAQLAWTVLGLEPQVMPDKSRGNVRLTVLKNRAWGYLGVADEFSIDDDTGEVVLANSVVHSF